MRGRKAISVDAPGLFSAVPALLRVAPEPLSVAAEPLSVAAEPLSVAAGLLRVVAEPLRVAPESLRVAAERSGDGARRGIFAIKMPKIWRNRLKTGALARIGLGAGLETQIMRILTKD